MFQDSFSIRHLSLDQITDLLEKATPPLRDPEKALLVTHWSCSRDKLVARLLSNYTRSVTDTGVILDLVESFDGERPCAMPVLARGASLGYKHSEKKSKSATKTFGSTQRGTVEGTHHRNVKKRPRSDSFSGGEDAAENLQKKEQRTQAEDEEDEASSISSRGRSRSVRDRSPMYRYFVKLIMRAALPAQDRMITCHLLPSITHHQTLIPSTISPPRPPTRLSLRITLMKSETRARARVKCIFSKSLSCEIFPKKCLIPEFILDDCLEMLKPEM